MPNQIFISYRRSDAGGHAGRLHDRLAECFEPDVLFYDLESIDGGVAFPARLTQALADACVVLVLIGPEWLAELRRRATLPDTDYVRREVELALQRHAHSGAPLVVPVLLGGAVPPRADELPSEVRALAELNVVAFQGNNADWRGKFAQLLELLAAVPGVPEPEPPAAARRRWPYAAAAALALAGFGGWSALQARAGLAEARDGLRIGRYDLAVQRLAAVPVLARWWPGLKFTRSKAELGRTLLVGAPDWEQFDTRLKSLHAAAPGDADLLVLQAQREVGAGRWDSAAQTAQRATAADDSHAEAWFVRASVHDAQLDLKQAEAGYRKAAELARGSPHYQSNLAHTLLEAGRPAEAIETYERIPRFPLAALEQAKAHWARGEYGLAAERQQAAIALLGDAQVSGEYYNLRPWAFYTAEQAVLLGPPADKLCYARLSQAASLHLAGRSGAAALAPVAFPPAAFPPADCAQPSCAVRQVLDFDLQKYPATPDAAAQAAAGRLRQALGDTARCIPAATALPETAPAASTPRH